MPRILGARRSSAFLARSVLAILSLWILSTPTLAADAKPVKKDSPARAKPNDVTVTATAEPLEVRPGGKVTYTVSARLNPGWHIYTYSEKQPDQGPRATQFDFFDPDGLKVVGNWKPSKEAHRKQEPAFNNLEVAFYEDEVSWSVELQAPADIAPGKKTLRCQASYQICNAMSCSFPGRWTLPEVAINVVGGGEQQSAAAPATTIEAPAAPTETGASNPTEKTAETEKPASADKTAEAEPPVPTKTSPALVDVQPRATSEVEATAQKGILPLMVMSALGGLLALVMPCVWPMVPVTVNFFVKQGEKNKGKTTALAVSYCLAIIGVFTAVGVLCSFFVSATALPRLANSPWLNLFVAGLFILFGLSLLGLFEISLPSFLLNASAKGENRGGLIGVMFMALTLTITSFTCTFPVVGGLLVMASTGQFFYPIIGLATFSTVVALPFFLLALSPSLLSKMPKSGDWMNAVKVVGGLIELGAALKFLNSAELAFVTADDAWINAQLMLTVWVVLAAVCGFYLLGFFRTDHDHDEVKVGAGRMLTGAAFLGVALFFAPALFGRPPQSPVWNLMVGFLPDAARLGHSGGGGSALAMAGAGGGEVHATDTDPEKAQRQEKRFHGVSWGFSYEEALERARTEGKPILIDFTGVNCVNCRTMEQTVLPRPEVVDVLKQFITIELYTDYVQIGSITSEQRQTLAEQNQKRQLDLTNDATNPFYVVLSPAGKVLGTKGGLMSPDDFIGFLKQSLDQRADNARIAQSGGRQ